MLSGSYLPAALLCHHSYVTALSSLITLCTPPKAPSPNSGTAQSMAKHNTSDAATCNQHLMERRVRGNLMLESWNCLTLSRLHSAGGTVAVLMICTTGGLALCLDPISCHGTSKFQQ